MTSSHSIAALLLVPLLAQPAFAEQTVSGQVVDLQGRPLPKVFVRQEGAIVTGFTDANGRYSLQLSPEGVPFLVFSAEGYQLARMPVAGARKVSLTPVETYLPPYRPLLSTLPTRAAQQPLDTQLHLAYQAGTFDASFSGNRLSGALDNQLALGGQVRHDGWLFGGRFERFKAGLALSTLPNSETAAFTPEESSYRLRLGYVLGGATWELAPSLSFLNSNFEAANVPLSGTPYDYAHDRRGLGFEAPFAWALSHRLDFLGAIAYHPALFFNAVRAPYVVAGTRMWEAELGLGYAVTPSLRLDLRYRHQAWAGDLALDRDDLMLGVTFRPQRVAP